jgi:hypothetical protein
VKQDLSKWLRELHKLEQHIAYIAGADARRKGALAERSAAYAAVFDTLVEEQVILDELYQPLRKRLHASGHTAARLEFTVVRRVDVDAWVGRGEELLDLRSANRRRPLKATTSAATSSVLPAGSRTVSRAPSPAVRSTTAPVAPGAGAPINCVPLSSTNPLLAAEGATGHT